MKWSCFYILFLVVLFTSCDSKSVYIEYQSVGPDLSWHVEDVKIFEFTVEESGVYDINLIISYISGYPWDKARINCKLKGREKEVQRNSFEIIIQDAPGKYRGEPSLDYWLVEDELLKNQKLESGKYWIELSHDMPNEEFPYISEVGIRVIDTKK